MQRYAAVRLNGEMMIYIKVRWKHDDPNDPILLYSELDDERWEVRKAEVFSDGSSGYADPAAARGTTLLGLIPIPTLSEIAAIPEFDPVAITKDEFEAVWLKAIRQA
jgi:uncharacterized protein DUF6881